MRILKLLIVDDEPLAHKVLESYCDKVKGVQVVGNCYDIFQTIEFVNQNKVDCLLLDIEMPDLSGIEFVKDLKSNALKVIFTTAHTEYALESFQFDNVIDYLHKPIRIARFIKSLERLRRIIELETSPRAESANSAAAEFIQITDNNTILRLAANHILFIEAYGNYAKIHTDNEKVKVVRNTISKIELSLSNHAFLRVHKSYIINCQHISKISKTTIHLATKEIPIGNSYKMLVKNQFSPD
ncbi:MAG: LytR/AlgR family response regulator transcription factor [Bacteroidia bacterium]